MRTPSSAALLLLLVAACSETVDPQKPPDPADAVFTIADRSLWAGSGMLIESEAFAGLGSPPDVRLEGVPLQVSRIGPEVFEAKLPTTASGQYLPTISVGKGMVDLPSITVAGFSGAEEFGFSMALGAEAMPGTGNATLIGASLFPGELDGRLTFVHLETGSHERFEGPLYDFDQLRTPGTSYRVGVMFGQTAEGIRPFSLYGASVVLEDPISVTFARQIAELAEGVYLVTSHHHVSISDGSYDQQLEESQGIALSYAAGRATVWGGNTMNIGLPVFTVPGGSLAYLLTEVFRPTAVDFSPEGDVLAVTGAEPAGNMLRIFRASDGELLEERTLPRQPVALSFDAVRPLLYVGLGGTYGNPATLKPSVMVFDRATFLPIGHMSAAAADLSCESGCVEAEIVVSAEPAVYLAGFLNSPLRTFRFSIPGE